MTALTNPSFAFPKLGTMLDALNQTIQNRTNSKSTAFGKTVEKGAALESCHWNSLSDVRRHRHIKFVHHIRVTQEGSSVRLNMMHFKPAKNDTLTHHIDLATAFMHTILIEHASNGAVDRVSFGMEQGQQDPANIPLTQTLEGNMARQFITTLSRGWIRNMLPKKELALVVGPALRSASMPDLSALLESTQIMVERAATMHERMLTNYDNPATSRTLDQAVLHIYEKGDTEIQAAALFDVDPQDVVSRKVFFDRISDALGKPASKLVVEHLVQSEQDEGMANQMDFRRTPDTPLMASV